MMPSALPSGMVTFLFTDIEGSSTKWDKAKPAMEKALRRHDSVLESAITDNNGTLVKAMGDGFMAAFDDPANTVSAAIAAQVGLESQTWGATIGPIRARIGIHTGPGEPLERDYVGPAPNRAARIEAAGHGGQTLVSAATRELVGDRLGNCDFVDLGEHQLRGLKRPERIYQVVGEGLSTEFPPLRTESTPTNLPAPVKTVVGRVRELAELSAALDEARLLTVTGAGGAGKTTLAIEAARRRLDDHPGGVWLIELASLSDGRRLATEMLGAMRRATPADADPIDALRNALAAQRALLLIDNCEHLLDEVADLVSAIVHNAPAVTVLATSRRPLGLGGEQVWTIPTMDLPVDAATEAVLSSDAGALFAERAHAADPSFRVTGDNAGLVADICRRLDGLPLAIELAAARLRSMNLSEIHGRLEDRFRLLRGGERDAMDHHQTLHAAVSWSYELLSAEEQRLYRCLSVFAGGFGLDAAEAVAGDEVDVLDGLDHLVAQSLLEIERGGDESRYQMLDTIRQFGEERLQAAGDLAAVAQAHLEWVLSLVKEGARQLEGRGQAEWLSRFRVEIDNIRKALTWARDEDPVTGSVIVSAMSRFFWMYAAQGETSAPTDTTSFLREGYEWATTMLDAAGDDLLEGIRARLQMGTGGLLCVRLGLYEEALERLAEAGEIFERLGETRNLGWATFYRGVAGFGLMSVDDSAETFSRSLELHTEAEDNFGILMSRLLLSFALALVDLAAGREAFKPYEEGAVRSGVPFLTAHASDWNAMYDAMEGNVGERSRRSAATALSSFRGVGNYGCIYHALGSAASVLAADEDDEGAARAMGVADATRRRLSMAVPPYEDRESWVRDAARGAYGTAHWQATRAEGATFEIDEGIDWVIQRLGFDPADPPG